MRHPFSPLFLWLLLAVFEKLRVRGDGTLQGILSRGNGENEHTQAQAERTTSRRCTDPKKRTEDDEWRMYRNRSRLTEGLV
jgi:hypothetical protein